MAKRRKLVMEHPATRFEKKCAVHLLTAKQQKTRATEMNKTAQGMRHRAQEMMKQRRHFSLG